jgi:translation elongation factor EF-G
MADHNSITPDEMRAVIRKATIEHRITPVFCGASFKNKGVQPLLDAIVSITCLIRQRLNQLKVLIPY